MVLETVVELGWDIPQLDVQTALINANAEEEVCVKMAPGYEKEDEQTGVPLVMRLQTKNLVPSSSEPQKLARQH